jgi:hypothetical protein
MLRSRASELLDDALQGGGKVKVAHVTFAWRLLLPLWVGGALLAAPPSRAQAMITISAQAADVGEFVDLALAREQSLDMHAVTVQGRGALGFALMLPTGHKLLWLQFQPTAQFGGFRPPAFALKDITRLSGHSLRIPKGRLRVVALCSEPCKIFLPLNVATVRHELITHDHLGGLMVHESDPSGTPIGSRFRSATPGRRALVVVATGVFYRLQDIHDVVGPSTISQACLTVSGPSPVCVTDELMYNSDFEFDMQDSLAHSSEARVYDRPGENVRSWHLGGSTTFLGRHDTLLVINW